MIFPLCGPSGNKRLRYHAVALTNGRRTNERDVRQVGRLRQAEGGEGQAVADPDLFRPLLRQGVERALPDQPGARPDRPFRGVRPADPDRLRQRPSAGAGRGGQGRRAGRAPGRHARPVRRHPAREDEYLHDHQRHGAVAAVALHRRGRGAGRRQGQAQRHRAERHHQGVSQPRHLHLPACALDAADHRHHQLHLPRAAEVEPDQRLLVPPAGSRRDAGAGGGVRAGHRHRRAGFRARLGPGAEGRVPDRRRPDQLLRQRRRALHHRDVEDARLHRTVGRADGPALRHRGREPAPLPLWRAGELPRSHRAAAREQRLPHPAVHAGGHPVEERPRPRGAASGMERGAGPAAPVGPAVEPAPAADRRL